MGSHCVFGLPEFGSFAAVERLRGFFAQLRDAVPMALDEPGLFAAEFARGGVIAFPENLFAATAGAL